MLTIKGWENKMYNINTAVCCCGKGLIFVESLGGVCSFGRNVNTDFFRKVVLNTNNPLKYISKNLVIGTNGGKEARREGLYLCYTGEIRNTAEIKRKFGIKDVSEAEVVLSLYEIEGDGFITYLDGSFLIILCSEIDGYLLIFADDAARKDLYFIVSGSDIIFCDSLKGLLATGLTEIDKDRAAMSIFSCPPWYLMPLSENIGKLFPMSGMYLDSEEIRILVYTPEKKDGYLFSCLSGYEQAFGDEYMYSLCDSCFEAFCPVPPDIIASAVRCGEFTDRMFLDCLISLKGSKAFPMLFSTLEDTRNVLKDEYAGNENAAETIYNILSDIYSFEYTDDSYAQTNEYMYLNLRCVLSPVASNISRICTLYNIKNSVSLLSGRGLENMRKLILKRGISCLDLFEPADRKILLRESASERILKLLENRSAPVFKTVDRDRLEKELENMDDFSLIFILRANHFLEILEDF